jgi:hypothetical protein
MSSLAETVSNVSDGLTNLAANLATNITGWVHDLASAFDAGWGEDEQEEWVPQCSNSRHAVPSMLNTAREHPHHQLVYSWLVFAG